MDEGMTIAQVAQRTGLSAHTLRYYERAGTPNSSAGARTPTWPARSCSRPTGPP
ncbi:MerR family DNA-binding transcriptional regulator [Microbispora sp. CA-102843]|uniref:MerR family DNA-binding transcriptional regulator n=1 Tax=Microbispora sp. CA-102843 TaxID=3239952 RepID=UPI003D906DAC